MKDSTPQSGVAPSGSGAEARREVTVSFLPHRVNRQPVIVRGLTADELWFTVGFSAAVGFALGVILAVWFSSIAIAPTCVVFCVAGGLFFGGGLLRRYKRGRPDTWLVRQIQWWARQHAPFACSLIGGQELIVRSGYWNTRRMPAQSRQRRRTKARLHSALTSLFR